MMRADPTSKQSVHAGRGLGGVFILGDCGMTRQQGRPASAPGGVQGRARAAAVSHGALLAIWLLGCTFAAAAPPPATGATNSAPARPEDRAGVSAAPVVPAMRPPTAVTVADAPNDDGGRIVVRWSPSPDDARENAAFAGYLILRAPVPEGPFAEVGRAPRGLGEFLDAEGLRNGTRYWYRVRATGEAEVPAGGEAAAGATEGASASGVPSPVDDISVSGIAGPAVPKGQWFHLGRISMLVAVLVLSGFVLYYIEHARRGGNIFIRKIAGLEAVDEAVGRATEMGRRILYIPGTQDMDQVQTLAGIAILGRVARLTAEYETSLTVPVSRSLVMVAARETVKESYLATGRPELYNDDMVYYLTDDQFGYAAALEGIMVREKPATIFMQGSFYAESLILAETGNSIGAIQIAGTAQPAQLPFFVAACDYTLLGEELFVAGAYLSREPRQLGSIKGQDLAKAVILLVLLAGAVVQTLHLFDFTRLLRAE